MALAPASSATAVAPQAADRPVPFKAGEVLTYDVSWSGVVTAGTATLTVKERRPGAAGAFVYDLIGEGRPNSLLDRLYHLYYKAESLLDTRTLRPSIATLFSGEGSQSSLRSVRFVSPTGVELEPDVGSTKARYAVPKQTLDPLSAMYVLRATPAKAGQVVSMSVFDDGSVYTVRWLFGGVESISTPVGAIPAWRLAPTLTDEKGKPVTKYRVIVWLSTDSRRLPVKFQAALPVGSFTLTLSKITP